MYILKLNSSFLAQQGSSQQSMSASFNMSHLSPYMTQNVEMKLHPEPLEVPVVNWQLSKQIQERRKEFPELKAFRMNKYNEDEEEEKRPHKLKNFSNKEPGSVLLLMANMKRGLGDMILLQPVYRAQARRLKKMGWSGQLGISSSNEFQHLFYGQDFLGDFLPEMPSLKSVMNYDYVLEYGMSLERMKSLLDIGSWDEIDLRVQLKVPSVIGGKWQNHFQGSSKRIFLHWGSFDPQRQLPANWFNNIVDNFPDAKFYCSLFNNNTQGAIFPGGPENLWAYENNLLDLFQIIDQMDAVVTTNTGIAHLSAALGKPTIVIFSGRLYGWTDFWPMHHEQLYPTMQPVGLKEHLQLPVEVIFKQVNEKLTKIFNSQ